MEIALLGPLELRTEPDPESGPGSDASPGLQSRPAGTRLRALLAMLALDAGRVVPVPRLINGIWGDEPLPNAASALQALVSRLRRVLPAGSIQRRPGGYLLAVPPDAVDVHRFERLVTTGRAALPEDPARAAALLRDALALWRGDILTDLADADAARSAVARLGELRLAAIEDRIDADLTLSLPAGPAHAPTAEPARGPLGDLIPELYALTAEYPLRERFACQLVRALHAAGRRADALQAYSRARTALVEELGADPSPALAAAHLDVLRARQPTGAAAVGGPRHNLRARVSSFLGRDADLVRVAELVDRNRLVTLIGPGGAGKSRLAVEVAESLVGPLWPDGVWLIELAGVGRPGAPLGGTVAPGSALTETTLTETTLAETTLAETVLTETVLAGLGLHGQVPPGGRFAGVPGTTGADPFGRLIAALAGKRLLLVLDNCEHLIDPTARLVNGVLGGCPQVRVLATSRAPIGITGEALWPVEPLAVPPRGFDAASARSTRCVASAAGYPSVTLFADRAAAVRPGFAVDDTNVAAVVRLCRALDGLPLAIELAAARLRVLSPAQLAEHVDGRDFGRLRLRHRGGGVVAERHRTLQAMIDWSWHLLDDGGRVLWRRLAVFAGGVTLDAAGQIYPERAEPILDLIATLVDQSLLTLDTGADVAGQPRYRMLETIRGYGLERLADAGEERTVRRAHARYHLELAERVEREQRRGGRRRASRRLEAEHDNLRAALSWALVDDDAATAARLVVALATFWSHGGRQAEGAVLTDATIALLDRCRAAGSEVPVAPEALASVYGLGALIALGVDRDPGSTPTRFATAAALVAQGTCAVGSTTGPAGEIIDPTVWLFPPLAALLFTGDERPLRALLDETAGSDSVFAATARFFYATTMVQLGRPGDGARTELRAAVDLCRRLDSHVWSPTMLLCLGDLSSREGTHDQAAACYAEALDRVAESGAGEELRPVLRARYARAVWLDGQRELALSVLDQARRDAEAAGQPEGLAIVEYALGDLAWLDGDGERARRHLDRSGDLVTGAPTTPQLRASLLGALALSDASRGDLAGAACRHRDAFTIAVELHDAPSIARALVGIADLVLRLDDPARAATLLGAAVAVRGEPDLSNTDAPRVAAAARAALGEHRFAEAYRRGRDLDRGGAQRLALAGTAVVAPPGPATTGPGGAFGPSGDSRPAAERAYRERHEHHGDRGEPE